MFHGARILITPLDWGLGHSTRDIPIIQRLLELDARPLIGADKAPLTLLRDAFPELPYVRIPGVNVRYARGRSQTWVLARQFPSMLRSVREEQLALREVMRAHPLDAVISDQRFGLRTDRLASVLITHQVYPFTPFAQRALRAANLRSITRFDRCWIPDDPIAPGLAGDLSHGIAPPMNATYIGPLSRMDTAKAIAPREPYRIVCVISGPEPQRSLLEAALMRQLPRIPGHHLMVLGRPDPPLDEHVGNVHRLGHLGGDRLAGVLLHADLIVSRTGYTTLMDLASIGRSALLVPTPGQDEQEYLGVLHARTGRFHIQAQDRLDLPGAWEQGVRSTTDRPAPARTERLEQALGDLAALIAARSGTGKARP